MRMVLRLVVLCWIYLASAALAFAQEDDKGFLTRSLQDAFSGAGRTVSIDGFQGALSASASFDRMTIADDAGVWLTLEGVTLDWTRSALLRGRLEVQRLTAERLDLPRLPQSEESSLPEAEAAPFELPQLPVSIQIDTFSIAEINLGAPLLGEAAQLSITATAQLTDQLGDIDLVAERTDAKRGRFAIKANFERRDSLLDLLLDLSEGEDGIAARLLNLPGQPSVDLSVAGSGPIDDFAADVAVRTDGQDRLSGQITLGTQAPRRASAAPDRRIQADIGGDITALLAPRYRAFFGTDVSLTADALLEANGAIEVSTFALNTNAAQLQGAVTLNAEQWPTLIDISGRIANPDGTPTLLPLGGEATTVRDITLRVAYDAADGDAIDAGFDVLGLQTADLAMAEAKLSLQGILQPDLGRVGRFEGDVALGTNGVSLNDQALAEALGQQITGQAKVIHVEGQPLEISGLDLGGTDYTLSGEAVIQGLDTGFATDLTAELDTNDLARFSALAGREIDGKSRLSLQGEIVPLSGQFDLGATGQVEGLALGIPQADAVLAGQTAFSLSARRNETGTFVKDLQLDNAALSLSGDAALRTDNSRVAVDFALKDISLVLPEYAGPISATLKADQDARGWTIDAITDGPYGAALTAKGLATGPDAALYFTADVPDVRPFAPDLQGPVKADGKLQRTADGWRITTDATGPYQLRAVLDGDITPTLDVAFDVSAPDVQPIVPQLRGPMQARGQLRQTDKGYFVRTDAQGPYQSTARVEGLATGPAMLLNFDLAVPNVAPLAPGLTGPLQARGEVRQTPDGIALNTTASGPFSTRAAVTGVVTGPDAKLRFDLDMPNIGAVVDKVNGPLRLNGTAEKAGADWRLETDAAGPAGTQAQLAGWVRGNGTLDLDVAGSAPLGLSRPFLAPRDLQGLARFDLKVQGPPALSSLSGAISTRDATFSAPNLRVALQNIAADITLARNRADVNLTGQASNGGQLQLGGAVTLTPSLPADLEIGLNNFVLIDPWLYQTSLNGQMRLSGPMTGGAQIAGRLDVGETTVNVPSTGLTSVGDIPPITHIGATPGVEQTLRKAGISGQGEAAATDTGPGFGLNLLVNAPNRIFVRGRGLDAELGGGLRLSGTTNRIISSGRFALLRGRLDILGKRFDLIEGSIQFLGDLIPYIRFVSATSTQGGEARVIVEGPADEPVVSFQSTPAAPEDEVLAQLLFGRRISDISPFQALQLANAVATLAGRGGIGVIDNLRSGFGLDDLDVTTTDSGATAVRAGKYISDNVYTDVTAASDGSGEVSLNLDITPNLKGKATLGSDGNSGIGIFFEKDY